jgi:hypothetical protein
MMNQYERGYWGENSDNGERRLSIPQHGAVSFCSPITNITARGNVCFEQQVQINPAQFDIDSDDANILWYSVSPDEANGEECVELPTITLTFYAVLSSLTN